MGLDMYLRAEVYLSGYEFTPDEKKDRYRRALDASGLQAAADPETPSLTVSVTVAYWRKANHIHAWFVENVQGGEDECKPHYVSREQLEELLAVCRRVLAESKTEPGTVTAGKRWVDGVWELIEQEGERIADPAVAQELLPTRSGFFFGSTDYDEWYLQSVEDTVRQLERVLANTPADCDLEYQSSW